MGEHHELSPPGKGICAPYITGGVGTYDLPEDISTGTVVTTILAVSDKTLIYSIVADNSNGRFEINSTTGEVRIANKLDYEPAQQHKLTIKASDGTNTEEGVVIVNVADVYEGSELYDDPVVVPDKGQGGSSSNNGGGGCSLQAGSSFDPLFPTMLIFALFYLGYRIRAGQQKCH